MWWACATSSSQYELHKRCVATQVKGYIVSVTAVLILVNGIVPRSTVGIHDELSTLSAVFPKLLTSNTAFILTNISSPLSWNVCQDTVPAIPKAPQFQINNPVALQTRYLRIKDDLEMENMRVRMRKDVAEQDALDVLGHESL